MTRLDPARVTPARIQLSRRFGFNLQEVSRALNGLPAVMVARPSIWGNPFVIGRPSGYLFQDGGDPTPLIAALSREQAVSFYDDLLNGFVGPEMHPWGHEWQEAVRKHFHGMSPGEAASCYLRNRNLACWCSLDRACHVDPLLRTANR